MTSAGRADARSPNSPATPGQVIAPLTVFNPSASASESRQACRQPLPASWTTYGRVALVNAQVDVFGTAPGMFATQ